MIVLKFKRRNAMTIWIKFLTAIAMLLAFSAQAANSGKILVAVSSENKLALKNGQFLDTGYYLNELGVPAKRLVDAGYTLVFANPKGNTPTMDKNSDSVDHFGGNQAKYAEIKAFHDNLASLKQPQTLQAIIDGGLDQYAGLFVPGGHAPMIDLMQSQAFGQILKHFNAQAKPTALICHGPVALAAATQNPVAYKKALASGNVMAQKKAAKNWIYAGYNMTVFSTSEEKVAEKNIGNKLQFYPQDALSAAGGKVQVGNDWAPYVIQDRELITGQNPASDEQLAEAMIKALQQKQ